MRYAPILKFTGALLVIASLSGCYYYTDGDVVLDLEIPDFDSVALDGGVVIKEECKALHEQNNQLIKDFTAKETECDNIEAEYNAHPDKTSKEAQAIVTRHRACLAELQKISDEQKPIADQLKECQGE